MVLEFGPQVADGGRIEGADAQFQTLEAQAFDGLEVLAPDVGRWQVEPGGVVRIERAAAEGVDDLHRGSSLLTGGDSRGLASVGGL